MWKFPSISYPLVAHYMRARKIVSGHSNNLQTVTQYGPFFYCTLDQPVFGHGNKFHTSNVISAMLLNCVTP